MSDTVERNYIAERMNVFHELHQQVSELSSLIDVFNKETGGDLPSLNTFVTAHNFLLSNRIILSRGGDDLIFIEHFAKIYETLVSTFEKQASEIEARPDTDAYRRKELHRTREGIEDTKKMLGDFASRYKEDITAETGTEDYARDAAGLAKLLKTLGDATKYGKWEREFVPVPNEATGEVRQAELPHSTRMTEVAAMAPKFRALGSFMKLGQE